VRRCDGPGASIANRLNWVSVINKLDYAHLHGFEFWLHAEQVPINTWGAYAMLPPSMTCVWTIPQCFP
jgi:hypothetical protein